MRRVRLLLLVLSATVATAAAAAPSAAAGTLRVSGGVVSYIETDPNARNSVNVVVSRAGDRISFGDSGRTGASAITIRSDGSCTANRSSGSCPAAGVTRIEIATGELDDTVTQRTAIPTGIRGGTGNDRLTGGTGDDQLVGEAGADLLTGGAGRDSADYGERTAPLAVSLDGHAGDGEAGENDNVAADIEVVVGGAGADSISGTDADNALHGNAGNDSFAGGAGNDHLDGGTGDDTLDGGTGGDALLGGEGTDTASYASSTVGVRVVLDGQPGDGAPGENDVVDAENVVGSGAGDVLIGSAAPNVINAGAGNDRVLAGGGGDAVDGGAGDDILQTLDGAQDLVACGEGEDGVVSDRSDVRTDCDYIKYRVLAAGDTSVRVSKGAVRIPVRCSPATVEGCRGSATVKVGRRTIGARRVRLPSGRRWVAKIALNRRGRALVRRKRRITASLVVRDRDAAGVLTVTTQTIRIAR